jgi:hypothetical protein
VLGHHRDERGSGEDVEGVLEVYLDHATLAAAWASRTERSACPIASDPPVVRTSYTHVKLEQVQRVPDVWGMQRERTRQQCASRLLGW